MTYRIAIRTRWGRRHEVNGQFVPIANGVLAVFMWKKGWWVIHVPSGFAFPKQLATSGQAHSWAKLFWLTLSPVEQTQLITSVTPRSVVTASLHAWSVVQADQSHLIHDLEAV